ncbi:hypothetical protein [Photobacterium ganghwense]|uniref:hypothetical protein n=1 Tax=Photobacterium ganghwense TaxID=320778 RepID=UPI001C2D73B9|nr:hypothetical protein [Photobacterium ganghwense]MBV1842225.1 hypothetical protein [Photobacterium ganghwense]
MNPTEFLKKNIIEHLMKQGINEANAEYCAIQGIQFFEKKTSNTKDAFNDACNHAGLIAEQRCFGFKYKPPVSKTTRRLKRPQEAFNF